ncbi:dTMP kinase [bacterium TMED277]|nr:dTMP kinase [Candidatus Pelagibacter sp.]OUX42105.1 MAG: dTMP kinase [bacterium TMED277]|tara:strand:- start:4154 stop:4801 length:648 start_codon:yes stop_codon:yes gene_type:complete
MYKKKSFFIVFEGVEGCGKSYQSKKLKRNLAKQGVNSLLTREPGGTIGAEFIRTLILKDYFNKEKKEKFDKYTDTLLYLAARNEHIKNKIQPALKKRRVVICDRFIDSTLAYQVYGKKVNKSFIDHIHRFILNGIKPDITFVLKVSSKTSKLRLKKRKTKNRYDNFPQSFYTKAQKSFLKIARNKPNYFVLDSSLDNNDLENKIFKIVSKYLKIK